jgi:hypothetical protein
LQAEEHAVVGVVVLLQPVGQDQPRRVVVRGIMSGFQ